MASTYSTNPFFIQISSTQSSGGDGLPAVSYSTTNGPLYSPQLENDDDPATPSDYVQFDQETTTSPRSNASSIYGSDYSSDIIVDPSNEPVIHADPVISSSASLFASTFFSSSSPGDGRWVILFTTCTVLFHFILFFLFNNPHTIH